jgi:chromosome segregation ATPase
MSDNLILNENNDEDGTSSFKSLEILKRIVAKGGAGGDDNMSKLAEESYRTLGEYKELGGKYSMAESSVAGLRHLLGEARNNIAKKDKELEKLKMDLKVLEDKLREQSESLIAEQASGKKLMESFQRQVGLLKTESEGQINKNLENLKKKDEEIERVIKDCEDRIKVFYFIFFYSI